MSKVITFEAFAPGTWNGMAFSRSDVEEIATNFKALEAYHKVPLKFGHNDQQPFTDGQPALGWVTKAEVNADGKLMLTAENVPDIVARAITQKLYRKVSVELDIGVEHKGKNYRYVLSGVALLGADIPAVNTLADLTHYLSDDKPALAASRRTVFSAIEGRITQEESEMDDAKIQAMIDKAVKPLADQNAELQTKLAEANSKIAQMTRDKDEAEKTKQAEKVKAARETITEKLESAVKQSLITPAQREYFISNMGVNDDARVLSADVDGYIKTVSGGKTVQLGRESGLGSESNERVHEDVGAEIVRLAKAEQGKDSKLSFIDAKRRVFKKHPDLAKEYLGGA